MFYKAQSWKVRTLTMCQSTLPLISHPFYFYLSKIGRKAMLQLEVAAYDVA